MNPSRTLTICTIIIYFSATKAFTMHNCHPAKHIRHLPVENSCKTIVTKLLTSISIYQDVELCTHIGTVCVSTAHDYFSKIERSGICSSLLMKFVVRKLKTCNSVVEAISETSLWHLNTVLRNRK